MKTDIKLSTAILLALALLVGACASESDVLTVGESTGKTVYGIGAEFDPHFLSQNVVKDDESKAEDWDSVIVRRLDMMKPSMFRAMVLTPWYEPENDNDDPDVIDWSKFTFDTPEMQSLYAELDYAESRGVKVILTLWGASINNWLAGENNGNWVVAPGDYEEWAENFSALMQYLLNEKHYTCIKQITPVNEPDWEYYMDGKAGPVSEYIKMCKILDERFRKDGIRDKVGFDLSDNSDGGTGTHKYLKACVEDMAEITDIYNSHTYIFGYETPNKTVLDWEKKNSELAAKAGKAHLIGEFGGNQCEGSARQRDIDWYERGVLMVRTALNTLNGGASGVSYWSLLDQNYNKDGSYESMQQLGLWRYVKSAYSTEPYYDSIPCDYSVRPQYFAYSLLTQFIRPGAKIYPLDAKDQFIAASAIQNENGTWVYVIANQTDSDHTYTVKNANVTGEFNVCRYKEGELPSDDSMLPIIGTVTVGADGLAVESPANTVVLLYSEPQK